MMKYKFSHTEKALIISIAIELVIIFLLFQIGFKEPPKEQTYAVEFVDDDFDFKQLQPEKKIELPDISKYISKRHRTNRASNALQEDKSYEEFRQHHESEMKNFYQNRNNPDAIDVAPETPAQKKKKKKKEIRFTGNSNIRYFIKNRHDLFVDNPLYTCPEDMHGTIAIDIQVDRNGNVILANYNKNKSTSTAGCLIENSIQAAYNSIFNASHTAPAVQKGYITYTY